MAKHVSTMKEFAKVIHNVLRSDRDVTVGIGGFTGEGKSTFSTKLAKAYAEVSQTYWGFDRMTWCRKELLTWIDGEKGTKKDQLPEYSCILSDELFKMFYRRTWFDEDQIDAIATFNMCRDRHLLNIGNIPNFWELDGGFQSRVRLYGYIPRRGVCWIFEQENNPFGNDPWNVRENRKTFRKKKNPYSCPNFVCVIYFEDWETKEKKDYYKIRNDKRLKAIDQNKPEKKERYRDIKEQRDRLINMLCNADKKITNKDIAEALGITPTAISLIRNGLR